MPLLGPPWILQLRNVTWKWLAGNDCWNRVFQLLLKSRQRIGRRDIVRKPLLELCCCDRKRSTANGWQFERRSLQMVRSMDSLMIASVRSPWFDPAERMVAHKKRKQKEMKLNRHCNASSHAIQHDKHKPTVSRQAYSTTQICPATSSYAKCKRMSVYLLYAICVCI